LTGAKRERGTTMAPALAKHSMAVLLCCFFGVGVAASGGGERCAACCAAVVGFFLALLRPFLDQKKKLTRPHRRLQLEHRRGRRVARVDRLGVLDQRQRQHPARGLERALEGREVHPQVVGVEVAVLGDVLEGRLVGV
jgi:hypothetical protein